MFKGIELDDFNNSFQNEDNCRRFLFRLKWKSGYLCRSCGNTEYIKGRTCYHARCSSCRYDESVTANTVFHQLHFSLLKAFRIAYHVTVYKKGISTVEISEIFGVNQKTAWLFKRKLQYAMMTHEFEGDNSSHLGKEVNADGIILSHRKGDLNGLQRIRLKLKRVKKSAGKTDFSILHSHNQDAFDPCQLVSGRYVDEGKNLMMWNFRTWLTGIHHHCSQKFLQGYLSEFSFRHRFRNNREMVWQELMRLMITTKPYLGLVKEAEMVNRV